MVAQPAPAGVGEREHRLADADVVDARSGSQRDRRGVAGLDRDGGEVEVGVRARHAAVLGAAVGERDGDLLAAQDVGVGQDGAGGGDHAGPATPAAAEADDGGADGVGCGCDRALKFVEYRHVGCS